MSLYRRKNREGKPGHFWVDARWRGAPRIQASTGTDNRGRAKAMLSTLRQLYEAGRHDVLGQIASGKLQLASVHAFWLNDRDGLSHAVARAASPEIGELADEWLRWIQTAGSLSPRTHRPYAPRSVDRYRVSLNRIYDSLPAGRLTKITDLTYGSLLAFRNKRREDVTGSSINRDLSALQALRRWAEEVQGLPLPRLRMPKERENAGRTSFLSRADIDCWLPLVPENWRLLFLMLLSTGMRIGEALGLTWADVRIGEGKICIGMSGRVKTETSRRDVPLSAGLAEALVAHARCFASGSADAVFPAGTYNYARARKLFARTASEAKLAAVRIHDLRHTFAVHALQAGVPLARLQKLMGHASPAMTLRYAAHAPEQHFAADAALVDGSMFGEKTLGVEATRPALRRA